VSDDEVLVVGAGPYGLTISAHLRERGIGHQIVGPVMDTWRSHMPEGMYLKSEPYSSVISAPKSGYDMATYCRTHDIGYVNRVHPVSREQLLGYGDWYAAQLVPGVVNDLVTSIRASGDGFEVGFAGQDSVTARQVVVATGVMPHVYLPPELSGLPPELVTHTSAHTDLSGFKGNTIAVIGAGQSALETAALLHESGADVRLLVRRDEIGWLAPNPEHISPIGRVRHPVVYLCEGWHCAFWDTPMAFRRLPKGMRITKARTVLGPAGAWWLKKRVVGVIDTLTGTTVTGAEPIGDRVRLTLGNGSTMDVDHVIAGTGYRFRADNISLIDPALLARITTLNGAPVLSRSCESSVPGLYITGAPAAVSLGPSMRFLAGTHNVGRYVARAIAGKTMPRRSEPALARA
jgi:FAD-dependent urate hydroxylase